MRRLLSALAVAALAVAVLPAAAGRAAAFAPDGQADAAGAELMRLTNLDRVALGKPAFAIDPTLAAVARDASWTCPSNPALVLTGRARDMADRNYFSHGVAGCVRPDGSLHRVLDALHTQFGYNTSRGENIAWNSYPTTSGTTQFGCAIDWTSCKGTTETIATVAAAQRAFMQSAGHRGAILGDFDRFGCGAAVAATGSKWYYTCLFSKGGPTAPDTTAPTMTALSMPSLVTSASAAFSASFGATDNTGVTGYQVRTRHGSAGIWSTATSQTASSRTFSGLAAGTWYVGVRARDAAGNWSPWRTAAAIVPADDRGYSFSRSMVRTTGTSYSRSTRTHTSTSGSGMTVRFSGTSLVVLGTTGVNHGKVRITIDGVAHTVDTGYYKGVRETGTHHRVVLFSASLPAGAHTAVLTCLGTSGRPTVAVDAIGWRD